MRTRLSVRVCRLGSVLMAAVLVASLAQAVVQVVAPGVAAAEPSVPLPPVASVPVTQPGRAAPPSGDETTPRALRGDQPGGGASLPGGGSYAATSLSPSATWQVSAQTGDFTWSYPLRVPPAAGGLQPNLALSYSSSAVDGLTSATNNQASWVGDGWSLWPGFIERGYRGCVDELDGGGEKPADLCWLSDNATLSLNGSGTQLIRDDATGVWRPKEDDGSRVERFGNPHDRNESWRVTTVDGTQYYFGSSAEAKSAWTAPVFGDDAGEPCHAGTFDASWCVHGYRWNLDKVIDRHGNMVLYSYEIETNFYGRNKNSAAESYVRGGWLRQVRYGLRADNPAIQASGQVVFDVADRCVPGSDCTWAKPANLPDVPLDLKCDGGSCVDKWSPTFWTTKRLSTITTQVRVGSDFVPVDSWTLRHELPDPGDGEKPALWLKGITHTGHRAATPISLPDVTFDGARKPNRVYGTDGYAQLIRFRMNAIISETGGTTSINYAEPDCVLGSRMPANPESNTLRCFPARWTPKHAPERTDYFHKYVVASVASHDGVAGTLAAETSYEYLDGAAWHWDTSEITKEDRKTWNEFRGFGRVRIRTGSGYDGPKTLTEQRFYRGMHGDRLPGGTRSVTISDSEGGGAADEDWLRGFVRETITYNGEAGPVVAKTITEPTWQGPTATRGPFKSYIVRSGVGRGYTALAAGGWRVTRVETAYDDRGLPVRVNDLADIGTPADDRCARTTYVRNTDKWLLNYPSRVETVSVHCGQTPVFPDHALSDTRVSYDGQDAGVAPVAGDPTRTEVAASRPASGPVYVTTATAGYDVHGRAVETADALGNTATVAFTPPVGGPVTQTRATTPPTPAVPAGLVTTTTLDPAFGQQTLVVDPNNRKIETTYDALGRKTEVWLGNRWRSQGEQGNLKFSYLVRKDGPIVVTTTKIGPNGRYTASTTLYDGLLRARQVQAPAVGGGRLLSDTRYDSHGRVVLVTHPYFNDAAVATDLVLPSDADVPGLTRTQFDGAGRPVAQIFDGNGTEKWRTTTSYGGDRVHVTPPAGATPTTTITDARGQTTELRQHSPTGYDTTGYTYTPAGQLASVTDPAGNTWRYTYDLRGRKTSDADPDKGTTSYTYDNADRLLSTTDARNVTLAHIYDPLGRKTATHEGTPSGRKLAEWIYDTALFGKGQLASSTRYVNGHAYSTSVYAYTGIYRPTDITTTIPAVEGPLAGEYIWYASWDWDGGLSGEAYSAAGGLPAETINYVRNDLGLPVSSSGAYNGTVELVGHADYTRYGELQRLELGEYPKRAWLSHYYDKHTRRPTRTIVDAEVPRPMQADLHYTHDPAGNLTSIADTPTDQPADTQCFAYDHLRRLTQAWTPTTGCAANPSTASLGGPAPYWHTYTYDQVGNRLSETQHATTGDTTRTFEYEVPGHAHALSSVTTVHPGGTTVLDRYGYDQAGNTTSRNLGGTAQTLDWNPEGHLAKVSEPGKVTEFLHTADGTRLLRRDPTGTTLYLNNQEIRLAAGTTTPVATRYYTFNGQVIAARQAATVTWLATDHQATAHIAINSDTMQVTRRRQVPFGAPRGTPPPTWPGGEKGFVGGTFDPSTGLTHLGARDYDPTLGRFISVDPIMDLADPQSWHGYAYANNNPVTWSDPNGLRIAGCEETGTSCKTGGPLQQPGPQAHTGNGRENGRWMDGKGTGSTWIPNRPQAPFNRRIGNDMVHADTWGIYINAYLAALRQFNDRRNGASAHQLADLQHCIDADEYCMGSGWLDVNEFLNYLCSHRGMICPGDRGSGLDDALAAAAESGLLFGGKDGGSAAGIRGGGSQSASCAASNSFPPDTQVLMADGTHKPINDVQVDDKVLATDPHTGKTEPQEVVATIVGHGTKNLVQITIDTDGDTGNATGIITATDEHPIWVNNQHRWINATDLKPGDTLETVAGEHPRVVGVRAYRGVRTVHNLTVDITHTYHVAAGTDDILVHNQGPICKGVHLNPGYNGPRERLTAPQQEDLVKWLNTGTGWNINKTNMRSQGQPVYQVTRGPFKGKYISHDVTGHRGGTWKMFGSEADARRGNRSGTYCFDLSCRIGD